MPENVDPWHGAGGKLATTSSTNSLGLHESGVHVNLGTEDDEDDNDDDDDESLMMRMTMMMWVQVNLETEDGDDDEGDEDDNDGKESRYPKMT